jgi:hypothetical protein
MNGFSASNGGKSKAILLPSIIQTFEAEFLAHYQDSILPGHCKALAAMQICRTTQSPVMLAQCDACESQLFVPHSCGHRNCPCLANIMRAHNGWNASSKNKCRPSIFC